MSEELPLIQILPEDEQNSHDIITRIRADRITDAGDVRALVSTYQFSSQETAKHVSDGMVALLKAGAFDPSNPEPTRVIMHAVAIDVERLALPDRE